VLPNAPIDAATGLPVPTIAVATDGGVSVIKDDGTVVDITHSSYSQSRKVFFPTDGGIAYTTDNSGSQRWLHVDHSLPSSDTSKADGYLGTGSDELYHTVDGSYYSGESMKFNIEGFYKGLIGVNDNGLAVATDSSAGNGVALISRNKSNPIAGMTAEISSTFNTGWLVGGADGTNVGGQVKGAVLATLSDTDNTAVTGSELVTNGTFATDSDWTKGAGWTIGSGVASHNSASGAGDLTQSLTLTVGKAYTIVVEITATDTTELYFAIDAGEYVQISGSPVGTHSHTFIASSTSQNVGVRASGNWDGSIDNISVRLAEEDRSVNGNGLQVFGTVTKNPVATGADLVAYSGFSSSNYLEQPNNTDLNLTSSTPFSAVCWVKNDGTSFEQIYKYRPSDDSGAFHQLLIASNVIRFVLGDGSNSATSDGATTIPTNVWNCLVATFDGNNTISVYLNGVLDDTTLLTASGATGNFYESDAVLRMGVNQSGINAASGTELALLRLSRTCLNPEQIAKIYEDEKVLFQENAQATLYGSSDAVTALAYDDSTNLLHVGTSAGRSVFQGLRRVDNTTTAVGAAISASNSLVADE